MGWLNKIFSKGKKKQDAHYNQQVSMKGYEPLFTAFGSTIYQSDIILSATHMKMRYFGKLTPKHIRLKDDGSTEIVKDDSVARILRKPNDFSTTYDFLTQAYFMREKDGTCFIYPDYYVSKSGAKIYTGMYILLPIMTPRIVQDETGKLFIQFEFVNPERMVQFPYEDIIVWKHDMEDNQFLGGGRFATMGRSDLLKNLEIYHQSSEALAEASKLGCYLDGVIKVNAYASDNEKTQKIRNQFIEDLKTNKSGIGVLDNGADYMNIQRSLKTIDSATLAEIKQNVMLHTGVTLDMLMSKMTSEEERTLYENWIEPASISLEQAMSAVFFSSWQTSYGDRVVIYPQEIDRMRTEDKLKLAQLWLTSGAGTYDEIRHLFGYAPLENGEGSQRPRAFNHLDGAINNDPILGGIDNGKNETE